MDEILNQLIEQYRAYAEVYRASTQPFKYALALQAGLQVDTEDKIIRESLIEHVGQLPLTAVFLYPHLDDPQVDLGETLIMLAVHDIGETVVGDQAIFVKTSQHADSESVEALKLLDEHYHSYYNDYENIKGVNAKFAKSVDKIVADILEFILDPQVSFARYKHVAGFEAGEIVEQKRKKKAQYMEWNPFLKEFYAHLLTKLEDRFAQAA